MAHHKFKSINICLYEKSSLYHTVGFLSKRCSFGWEYTEPNGVENVN